MNVVNKHLIGINLTRLEIVVAVWEKLADRMKGIINQWGRSF